MRNFSFKEWLDLVELARKKGSGPTPSEDDPRPEDPPAIEQPRKRKSIAPVPPSLKPSSYEEDPFNRRDANFKLDHGLILKALGIKHKGPMQPIMSGAGDARKPLTGSFANLYHHPLEETLAIKVTGDGDDYNHLRAAQRLRSPCITRVHGSAKLNDQAWALIVDFIPGEPMVYGGTQLIALIQGKYADDAETAARKLRAGRIGNTRQRILEGLDRWNQDEIDKLARLFDAIAGLQRLDIDISDFTENIIETPENYVIVDMGQ